MDLLKKVSLALFVSTAMLATAPSALAKPAGKIENATAAETEVAIDETLEQAAATLAAITDGTDKDTVVKMFKTTKQKAKTIESTVTYMLREKALGRLSKARSAYKKDKIEEATAKMTDSLNTFKKLKEKYHNF